MLSDLVERMRDQDRAIALDPANPQVAARIMTAFRSWRALEPERRKQARKVLVGLAKTDGLSRDVFEIAGKMIE